MEFRNITEEFETWLWIIKNPYNSIMNECFFNRLGSNLPEQIFITKGEIDK